MARATYALPDRALRLLDEARWLASAIGGLLLALVLFTYDRADPGWSNAGPPRDIQNAGGRLGAWVADLMLYLFGASSWLWVMLAVVLLWRGAVRLRARELSARGVKPSADPDAPRFAWDRWLGFALLFTGCVGLEAQRLHTLRLPLPLGPGGVAGDLLSDGLTLAIGGTATTVVLLALVANGLSLATGLSWLDAFERTGLLVERLGEALGRAVAARQDRVIGEKAAIERDGLVDEKKQKVAAGVRVAEPTLGGFGGEPSEADAAATAVEPTLAGTGPVAGEAVPAGHGVAAGEAVPAVFDAPIEPSFVVVADSAAGTDTVSFDGLPAGDAVDAVELPAWARAVPAASNEPPSAAVVVAAAERGDASGGDVAVAPSVQVAADLARSAIAVAAATGAASRATPDEAPEAAHEPDDDVAWPSLTATPVPAPVPPASAQARPLPPAPVAPQPSVVHPSPVVAQPAQPVARSVQPPVAALPVAPAPVAPLAQVTVRNDFVPALPTSPQATEWAAGDPRPGIGLLEPPPATVEIVSAEAIESSSRLIERKLADFGVATTVVTALPGPVITRYEIEPATGVKGSQIVNLSKDLARALAVTSIRVVETIPGKNLMGLELPNPRRQTVRLSEILGSRTFIDAASAVTMALGKDIGGHPVVADLARMPHLLVAGTTGSGKSVGINAMLLSLLYKADPSQVRLILIDPKMLEMSVYEGIPHLLAPVVTDMRQAGNALNWCVAEMERRYRVMSKLGVRNLAGYNVKIDEATRREELIPNPFSLTPDAPEPLGRLPQIVVVIDELADLMMVVGKKIEELIARLAQKARAAGIHLILATQRPSVDVITGLIKANIPTRIAFQVSSKIDSRTILDQMGAESLLGMGDMLYLAPGTGLPTRVHGAYVADDEVHRVVEHWKAMGDPDYVEGLLEGGVVEGADTGSAVGFGGLQQTLTEAGVEGEADPMYDQAVAVVLQHRRASISLVQRHLRIGYNRAARLLEQMEKSGVVSAMASNGNRDILVPAREE